MGKGQGEQGRLALELPGIGYSKPVPAMDEIVALCKRRGFIFPSSEVYGGLASTYDYGPYGTELKRNLKESWWQEIVRFRSDVVGLDAAILMSPKVWEASGHLDKFSDPMVQCLGKCKRQFREDQLEAESCPECGGELSEAREFNLMFRTQMGPSSDSSIAIYLRPETAQGIFVNFKNVLDSSNVRVPFGIAQIGKSFRNEITPANFTFRTREFEQMELEYFVHPDQAMEAYEYWKTERLNWYKRLGIDASKLRLREHEKDELAHYSVATADIEYQFPMGWSELEGVAHRGDYDLSRHTKPLKGSKDGNPSSGVRLHYTDPYSGEKYLPYVIEPSAGADRAFLAFITDAYRLEQVRDDTRTVLSLHPNLAPVKAAVVPVVKKDGLPEIAEKLYQELNRHLACEFDPVGKIGTAYRRQDEIGTPWCVTIDHETIEKQLVTIRDRDSMKQVSLDISKVKDELITRLNSQ